MVNGDEDRLRQVISNVVGNALVHTEPDVAVTLRVAQRERTGHRSTWRTPVKGMPREVAERATERFYRADPARSRHRGGSGLGLSIVDAAVAAHGGTVTIDSAPDRGTTVRLTFPAVPADGTDNVDVVGDRGDWKSGRPAQG